LNHVKRQVLHGVILDEAEQILPIDSSYYICYSSFQFRPAAASGGTIGQLRDQGNWPDVKIKGKRALSHESLRQHSSAHPQPSKISIQDITAGSWLLALGIWPKAKNQS
jgi:hypothetical protein